MRRITTSVGVMAMAALVASCGGSSDTKSAQAPPVFNEVVYEVKNVALESGPSRHRLSVGPLDVRKYSELRVYALGNYGGSPTITVGVTATDAEGLESYGALDVFDLNMSGGNNYATRVFDLPGEYIKVEFDSASAGGVSLIVYGRTSE